MIPTWPGALSDGAEALVPFVADLVPTVDLGHRRVVIDPPPGLLELAHESNAGVQAPGASGARAGAAEADPGPAAEWGGP